MAFSNLCITFGIGLLIGTLVQQINGDASDQAPICEVITVVEHQDYANSGSGEPNCLPFRTLHLALEHVKNRTLINVTIDVELSSIVPLKNLEFVTISGHNNPTVNCSNGGGLNLSFCHSCTIEGITWVGCGALPSKRKKGDLPSGHPAIMIDNSANTAIQNCYFQHSIMQAVILSETSGDVSISHCDFVDNSHYKGNGVAIHYSSSARDNSLSVFTISHCNFSHNAHGKNSGGSIVFIGESNLRSNIIIKDSTFDNNKGKTIFVFQQQNLRIDGTVVLKGNTANEGAAIFADNSTVTFGKMSRVNFIKNKATTAGGAIYLRDSSNLQFEDASVVTFTGNKAKNGGAMCLLSNCTILFDKNSNVTFLKNSASNDGGAIDCEDQTRVVFSSISTVSFHGNTARIGGALFLDIMSTVVFKGSAAVSFNRNKGKDNGGGLVLHSNSAILFMDRCRVNFTDNQANTGAAIRSNENCNITFANNSRVTFNGNRAYSGGAIQSENNGDIIFEGKSSISFNGNTATDGGSLHLLTDSNVIFKGNSYVTFYNNTAESSGGAIYTYGNSDVTIKECANINFTHNAAKTGGAVHSTKCDINITGKANIYFDNNYAVHQGGSIYLDDKTNVVFDKNATITLANNRADYGAGIYNDLSKDTTVMIDTEIHHHNNTARIAGDIFYMYIPPSCNKSCVDERIMGLDGTDIDLANFVNTPPKRIELYEPAVPNCNGNDSTAEECNMYYINNVMLGQEISINSCPIDYFNNPAIERVQLIVNTDIENFNSSSKYLLASCNLPLKFSITGNMARLMNVTMTLTTFELSVEDKIPITISITVMLSSCHPGFEYNPQTRKCECFHHDVVFCSASSSMIQKGYWFGEVEGKSTVAVCPSSYCDFSSCSKTSEFCQLSPERTNQCRSHRSGTVCGDCEKGYTLPFDSTECINEDNCTIVHTVIVIALTVVYWIALVITVFITMYYKVSIGYLYAITYYYSIVDILLSEYMDISNGLYITINVIYSIIKLTPQFLGQLCLVRGLSGIDQQFIHYVHPLAVSLMLVMIVMLARFSRRLSAFISRGIIRVICFLLLLSYTSVTITSLFLVRHLKYSDVDKLYTYLSPGMEYFQDRHLAYGIISSLCIIFVVIGIPLVLIAEPFLNHKISFTKIKPLLDQFQGCYKDKYRWFASYYMICRIAIITVIIIFSSTDFTSRYLLITICAAVVLIHLSIKPYTSKILNIFDGLLLLLLVLVAILLLAEFINSDSVVHITFALLTLPLIIFLALYLYIHKDAISKFFTSCMKRHNANENTGLPNPVIGGMGHTTDDSTRKKPSVTICDV